MTTFSKSVLTTFPLAVLLAACASSPAITTSSELKVERTPLSQKVLCRVRQMSRAKITGAVSTTIEKVLDFTVKNVDGLAISSEVVPVSATVNAKCEVVDSLYCVFGDAKRTTFIKASAKTSGSNLFVDYAEGPQLYQIECKERPVP
ncbi:MAG: hypothetical protein ABIR96_06210 [Bdellovibrionota bacterium]